MSSSDTTDEFGPELTTDEWIDTLLNTKGVVDCHIALDVTYFVERATILLHSSTLDYAERRVIEDSLLDITAYDEQDALLTRLRLNQVAPNMRQRLQTRELSQYIRYISDIES